FLKMTGFGLAGAGMFGCAAKTENHDPFPQTHRQNFNMAGYAAPRLDSVRVGIIGLGNRGSGAVRRLSRIEGVEIRGLCDLLPDRVDRARNALADTAHNPDGYSGSEDEYKKLCEREDIDLIYICTPWQWHTPQAVYAMEHEKHAATEIPAARTIEECWQLVETSERTRRHCMMLENVCYDSFEMLTLNMARQGFLGEIIHAEGAYIHDLMGNNFSSDNYQDMWRLKENASRNGNLYPCHGLGSIAQAMNLNTGDKMDYLVSVSGDDFMMEDRARELAAGDDFWDPFVGQPYRGNMNTSTIRTHKGRTLMLQHDVSSPRPYSRIHLLSGTKGIAQKYPEPARIALSHHGWVSDEEFRELEEQYTPEITKKIGEMARQVGGHGGMDTIMDWRLIDCLRNGIPLDMNVYDAALWSSIAPLSEWSVANRSNSIDVPDFTSGSWETNKPAMDIALNKGGNTGII
ncbi:MAG: Gfo/Idh/MocA family oxidoreductase, partial [Balneolales bacterium]